MCSIKIKTFNGKLQKLLVFKYFTTSDKLWQTQFNCHFTSKFNPLGQSEFLLINKMTLNGIAKQFVYHDSGMTWTFIIIHSWINLLIFTMNKSMLCIRYEINFHIQVQSIFITFSRKFITNSWKQINLETKQLVAWKLDCTSFMPATIKLLTDVFRSWPYFNNTIDFRGLIIKPCFSFQAMFCT